MVGDLRALVVVLQPPSRQEVWAMVAVSDPVPGSGARIVGVDGSAFEFPTVFVHEDQSGIEAAQEWADQNIRLWGDALVDPLVVVVEEPVEFRQEPLQEKVEEIFALAASVTGCRRCRIEGFSF